MHKALLVQGCHGFGPDHLAAAGIASVFVGLSASLEEITYRDRGRLLSETEQARLSVMLAEGYSNPLFYDV
jgi:hypothetical protein